MRLDKRSLQDGLNLQNNKIWLTILPTFLGIMLLCSSFGHAIEIADVPMATKIQKAPPNIMLVLDNSGSMDWGFMVEGTNSGVWGTSGNWWEKCTLRF